MMTSTDTTEFRGYSHSAEKSNRSLFARVRTLREGLGHDGIPMAVVQWWGNGAVWKDEGSTYDGDRVGRVVRAGVDISGTLRARAISA